MENSITNRQMVFLIFIATATVSQISLAKTLALAAGHGFWISLIIGAFIFGIMAVIITKLNNMYQGKVMFEYSREIVGNFVSYIIIFLYILYFLILSVYYGSTFTDIVGSDFLPKSPQWALIIIEIFVCGFIAYKGITNVARATEIIGALALITGILVFSAMLSQGRGYYILPLFDFKHIGEYIAATKSTIEPFIGMEILLVIPFTVKNKKAPKTAFLTMVGIGLFFILSFAATIVMTGMDTTVVYNDPLLEAVRLVQFPTVEILQRIDILYNTIGFMGNFLGVSVFYLGTVELLCRLIPKAKRAVLVVCSGVVMVIMSLIYKVMPIGPESSKMLVSYAAVPMIFLIPLILFIVAKVKKHAQKT